MNLHIVPDNTFINRFYDNLVELQVQDRNRIVVRTNSPALKAIRHQLPFAPLYSTKFSELVGDTSAYDKVFIHYFTPLLYRWVALNKFRELNWMVWGGDLYNLPDTDRICYEPFTFHKYVRKDFARNKILYNLKIFLTQWMFRKRAYSKVANILTWMEEEYRFACKHLPVKANHKFFFYENQMPYHVLDSIPKKDNKTGRPLLVLGNSGSASHNHLDAIRFLEENKIAVDLLIPVSYGDKKYITFVKNEARFSHGTVTFIDRYMPFDEYVTLINSADGMIMNTIRPQGYGNILTMMYLDKPVFFNAQNISLQDLDRHDIQWQPIENLKNPEVALHTSRENKMNVLALLSHERLIKDYGNYFG